MPLTNPWNDTPPRGARPAPRLRVDLAAARARHRAAATDLAALVDELVNEVTRLSTLLGSARRANADLLAAGRATLAALADGEDDPLFYLRDELPDPPPGQPRGWGR